MNQWISRPKGSRHQMLFKMPPEVNASNCACAFHWTIQLICSSHQAGMVLLRSGHLWSPHPAAMPEVYNIESSCPCRFCSPACCCLRIGAFGGLPGLACHGQVAALCLDPQRRGCAALLQRPKAAPHLLAGGPPRVGLTWRTASGSKCRPVRTRAWGHTRPCRPCLQTPLTRRSCARTATPGPSASWRHRSLPSGRGPTERRSCGS